MLELGYVVDFESGPQSEALFVFRGVEPVRV